MKFEVTVGNIGTVERTDSHKTAMATYREYVSQSKNNYGRAAGEDVVLWEDGEPIEEYYGGLNSSRYDENVKRITVDQIQRIVEQTLSASDGRRPFVNESPLSFDSLLSDVSTIAEQLRQNNVQFQKMDIDDSNYDSNLETRESLKRRLVPAMKALIARIERTD